MKSLILILSVIVAAVVYATSAKDVKDKTVDAANTAVDYSKEQKEAFQKDMEVKIDKMQDEITELKEAASKKSGAAKDSIKKQIAVLEDKQQAMKTDLVKLKNSSGRAWGKVKEGMGKTWDSMVETYDKAKAEFKE